MQTRLNTKPLKIKQDVPTRWNSTFDMLERFLATKEAVISTLALLDFKRCSLETEDWEIIEHSVKILKPFNEVTIEISSELTVSLSKTSILSRIMKIQVEKHLINPVPLCVQKLAEQFIDGISKRFVGRESDELIAQSIFLDSRFKKQVFGD